MSDTAAWSLLYKDALGQRMFAEIRRCDRTVWSATGACSTWGEGKAVTCESAFAATDLHKRMVAEFTALGYALERENAYDPRTFDYAALQREVEGCVASAFASICAANGDTRINAFALLTDGDAMTLSWSAASLGADASDDDRFDPFAWPIAGFEDRADIAYRMILSKVRGVPFEWVDGLPPDKLENRTHHGSPEGWLHRDGVFEVFVRALVALRKAGAFSSVGADFVLLAMPSDSEQIRGMAERLNAPATARRFVDWIGADAFFDLRPPKW